MSKRVKSVSMLLALMGAASTGMAYADVTPEAVHAKAVQ